MRRLSSQASLWRISHRGIVSRQCPGLLASVRWHGSHSHHHHHHNGENHTHEVLDLSSKEGTRVTLLGLASNVTLTGVKGVYGLLLNSSSLMAEALHSLGDLVSDFVTLYAYRLAREKANPQYPYGRGKIEPMGGLVVSGLLVGGGLGMANHSVDELLFFLNEKTSDKIAPVVDQVSSSPLLGFFEHSHDYSTLMSLSPYAALLLVGSIGLKEYLYRVTLKVGHRTKSSVLIANAYHHRSDVVTSVVALVGVGGAALGVPILDPIGGLVVSGMIFKMGLDSGLPSLKELMDMSVPDATLKHVQKALSELKVDENIVGFHSIRGRKMGPHIHIDLQLQVNPDITVSHAHQLAENVRHALLSHTTGISEVMVHVDSEPHDHSHHPSSPPVSTSELEKELIAWALEGNEADVKEVSHSVFHYRKEGIEVVLDISLYRDDMILRDARSIARRIRDKLKQHPKVYKADVHLELHEQSDH